MFSPLYTVDTHEYFAKLGIELAKSIETELGWIYIFGSKWKNLKIFLKNKIECNDSGFNVSCKYVLSVFYHKLTNISNQGFQNISQQIIQLNSNESLYSVAENIRNKLKNGEPFIETLGKYDQNSYEFEALIYYLLGEISESDWENITDVYWEKLSNFQFKDLLDKIYYSHSMKHIDLFQNVHFFISDKANSIQKIIYKGVNYAIDLPNEMPYKIPTIINQSIINNCSFLNILYQGVAPFLLDRSVGQAIEASSLCLDLLFWYGANLLDQINPLAIHDLIAFSSNTTVAPCVLNLFKQVLTDYSLVQSLEEIGYNIDLKTRSVPYVLKDNLIDVPMYLKNRIFFQIDSKSQYRDIDFINAYYAIYSVLEDGVFIENVKKMKSFLSEINNRVILHSICCDIFSLIFLQKENNYVFDYDKAKVVVSVLNNIVEIPEISTAALILNTTRPNSDSNKLSSYFQGTLSIFAQAIRYNDWTSAQNIAQQPNCKRLKIIFYVAMAVHGVEPPEGLKELELHLFHIEQFLAKNVYTNDLPSYVNSNDTVSFLLKHRLENVTNPLESIKAANWTPITQFASAFDDKEITILRNEILNGLQRSNLLYIFIRMLKYISKGDTNCIPKEPIDVFLMKALNNGDVKTAENFCQMTEISFFVAVVTLSDNISFNSNIIDALYKEDPISTLCLVLTNDTLKEFIDQIGSKHLKKLISDRPKIMPTFNEYMKSEEVDLGVEDDLFYSCGNPQIGNEFYVGKLRRLIDVLYPTNPSKYLAYYVILKQPGCDNEKFSSLIPKIDSSKLSFEEKVVVFKKFHNIDQSIIVKEAIESKANASYAIAEIEDLFFDIAKESSFEPKWLHQHCPNKLLPPFEAYQSLPMAIRGNLKFGENLRFDASNCMLVSIADFNENSLFLLSDEIIKEIALNEISQNQKNSNVHKIIRSIKRMLPNIYQQINFEIMCELIKKIKVDSIKSEFESIKKISALKNIAQCFISEKNFDIISLINDFLNERLFTIFGCSYSFEDFPSQTFGFYISKMLYLFDRTELGIKSIQIFNADQNSVLKDYVMDVSYIAIHDFQFANIVNAVVDEEYIIRFFNTAPAFDPMDISEFFAWKFNQDLPLLNQMNYIRGVIFQKLKKNNLKKFVAPGIITKFIKSPIVRARALCDIGLQTQAIMQVLSVGGNEVPLVNGILEWFIEHSTLDEFFQNFLKGDPGLRFSRNAFSIICDFFKSHEMINAMKSSFEFVNDPDGAAFAFADLYRVENDSGKKSEYIELIIQYCIRASFLKVESKIQSTGAVPYIQTKSNEEISYLLLLATIQKKLLELSSDIDVMSGSNMDLAYYALFIQGDFAGAKMIEEHLTRSYLSIQEEAFKDVIAKGAKYVIDFARVAHDMSEEQAIARFMIALSESTLRSMLPEVVSVAFKKPEEACNVLLQFGFVREAHRTATENKLDKSLEEVKRRAAMLGFMDIALA